jgi:ferritin-like protein
MERARQQGLKTTQLLQLLARNSAAEIPPSLVKALQRWELKGTEARVETKHILKVNRPEILTELRKSKAARFLEESLGPTTVVVKPGAKARVQAVMLEMGYLVDDAADES